jgi:hypothetical protein
VNYYHLALRYAPFDFNRLALIGKKMLNGKKKITD